MTGLFHVPYHPTSDGVDSVDQSFTKKRLEFEIT